MPAWQTGPMKDLLEQMVKRVQRHADPARLETDIPGLAVGVLLLPKSSAADRS